MSRRQAMRAGEQAAALRQVSEALRSGLSLREAAAVLAKIRPDSAGGASLARWASAAAQGAPLSSALAGEDLGESALALVRHGEETQSLPDALDVIAKDLEYRSVVRNAMKGALAWPVMTLAVLFLVVSITAIFVIPAFKDLYRGFGADLPAPTLIVIAISDFFVVWWLAIAAVIGAGAWVLTRPKLRERARAPFDRFAMRMPYLRDYLRAVFVVRLSQVVALTQHPDLFAHSIDYLRSTAGNARLSDVATALQAQLRSGRGIVDALWAVEDVPSSLSAAVEIGERSGKLGPTLERLAATLEFTAARSLVRFQQVMTIVMYASLAVIVGFVVVAMYLPIFKLGQAI